MKISYHSRWDENGTHYDQAISMDYQEVRSVQDAIHSEIALEYPRKKEYVFTSCGETFLVPLQVSDIGRGLVFMNHTQTRFINLFCKLPLKDRNTCIIKQRG